MMSAAFRWALTAWSTREAMSVSSWLSRSLTASAPVANERQPMVPPRASISTQNGTRSTYLSGHISGQRPAGRTFIAASRHEYDLKVYPQTPMQGAYLPLGTGFGNP